MMNNLLTQLENVKDENAKAIFKAILEEMTALNKPAELKFAKVRPDAIIPTKREEDAGFDIYSCFDANALIILPGETVLVPTGIATAFDMRYVFILKERGSTGTKGIAQRCGIIDSGYRDEIFAPITNTTNMPMVILKGDVENLPEIVTIYGGITYTKKAFEKLVKKATVYPYTKAITQGLFIELKKVESMEIPYKELLAIESERGTGKIGSSGK